MPIASYIREVGGPSDLTVEDQMRYVREVCHQKVKFDNHKPGVIVLDHSDGRKRVRVGQGSLREMAEDITDGSFW